MPILKKTIMIFTLLSLSTLIWIGCSDNTIVRFVDNPTEAEQTEAVESYFPLHGLFLCLVILLPSMPYIIMALGMHLDSFLEVAVGEYLEVKVLKVENVKETINLTAVW